MGDFGDLKGWSTGLDSVGGKSSDTKAPSSGSGKKSKAKGKSGKVVGFNEAMANVSEDRPRATGHGHHGGRCYEGHPPLKMPGTELVIHGGSCSAPAVKDAAVYIGLCSSMKLTSRAWPWVPGDEVYFPVTDMRAPSNPADFRKLVEWAKEQLEAGRKVHVGCIGGHGRTGTFLAALVSLFGEKDAIAYVRKNYCDRAVESTEQVTFLKQHFGVTPVAGAKTRAAQQNSDWAPSSKATSTRRVESRDPNRWLGRSTSISNGSCIWGHKGGKSLQSIAQRPASK